MQDKRKPLSSEAERFQLRFDFEKGGSVLASIDFAVDIQPAFSGVEETDAFLTFLADSSHKFYMETAKILKSRL